MINKRRQNIHAPKSMISETPPKMKTKHIEKKIKAGKESHAQKIYPCGL